MHLGPKIMTFTAFLLALVLSAVIAGGSATIIEKRSRSEMRVTLETAGHTWATVETDGLQVHLLGTAPSEAARFRALAVAATVVEASRIIDATDVAVTEAITPPAFSLEILRNDDGISLIGLVPVSIDRAAFLTELGQIAANGVVTDMLESADYQVPATWQQALDFGISALKTLPRSKISVAPGRVFITAITDSPTEKSRIETDLVRRTPKGLRLTLDISAPRPVITPFTLRFLIDENGARFDACSADTDRARSRILAAATDAGAQGVQGCTVGMGVPSPNWADSVTMGLAAIKTLGAGSITFSDADISLIAADTVSQATFDRVVGELESNLPEVFSLKAELTRKPTTSSEGPPEFAATLGANGQVQLRGRLTDAREREAVENFARARFGHSAVYGATRIDADLPEGWPVRVLAALEALDELTEGAVLVQPDLIRLSGVTGNAQASDVVARILSSRLGETARLDLAVRYDKRLDPVLGLPTGPECVARLNDVLAQSKIAFEPGSAVIADEAAATLDALAALMGNCADFRMEISGHTDSQGSEDFNLALSQERASAVVAALMQRRVLVGNLQARGYGETQPLGENETEAGREANRRIEFVLLDAKPLEQAPASAPADAAPGAATEPLPAEGTGTATAPESGVPDPAAPAATAATAQASQDGSIRIEVQPVEADTPRPQARPALPAADDN